MTRSPIRRASSGIVLLLLAIVVSATAYAGTTVNIYSGGDIPAVVEANPAGTAFIIHPGTYRVGTITPKTGDSFIGSTSCAPPKTACPAILNGSRLLTSFEKSGSYYYVTNQAQNNAVTIPSTKCEPMNPGYPIAYPGCIYPEDLYFDGTPLVHVTSLANVGTGTWYFDYSSNTIYFYDNPAGHTIEASVVPSAFSYGPANNVTIQGLTIEKYATPIMGGAIGGIPIGYFGSPSRGANWQVKNNEIELNHANGIVPNFGWQILNNYVHNNGNLGIGAGIGGGNADGSGTLSSNVLIEGNEIAYNNFAHVSPHYGAGGSKVLFTYNIVFRGNYSHNNEGSGFHDDTDNYGALYDNNISADNTEQGIFHEVSFHAIMRNNKLLRNGYIHPNGTFWLYGANLLSSTSQNVQAYCNTVEVSAAGGNGIDILTQPRTENIASQGNTFHHNTVVFDGNSGVTGGARSNPTASLEVNFFQVNAFDYNTYHLPELSRHAFAWNDKYNTFAEFQAAGQELHGSADTDYTATIPSVSITSPTDQTSVSGTVPIAVTATDPSSISKVVYYIDWTAASTDTTSPYTFNWNTSKVTAGSHIVTAMAYSSNGTRACYAITLNVK
jgi:Bacterial Ig domain